jgi:hypothetical protein
MIFGLDIRISKTVANLQEKCEEEKGVHMFWDPSNREKKN